MIRFRRTGPPQSFANKMGISLSFLYKLLAEMKEMGAPIHFSQLRQTYEYYEPVELQLGFQRPTQDSVQLSALASGATIIPLGRHKSAG